MSWINPVELHGKHVQLEPLRLDHVADLQAAAADGELWTLWYTSVPTPDATLAYVQTALALRDAANAMPFVVRAIATGKIIGCTRYCNIDNSNQRLEIGYTWYAKSVQRSAVNTESKLLLLQHAFEKLDAIAVEFRTHFFNQASRSAILRLGAKLDGVLRSHQRSADGVVRDTVVFSIIASEWPAVKQHLEYQLARG
jgi:N-acetyltransferase